MRIDRTWRDRLIGGVPGRTAKTTGSYRIVDVVQPDSRQTAILEEAAALGDAMARNMMYENTQRISVAKLFPGNPF